MRHASRRWMRASAPVAIAAYIVYVAINLPKIRLLCHDLRASVYVFR